MIKLYGSLEDYKDVYKELNKKIGEIIPLVDVPCSKIRYLDLKTLFISSLKITDEERSNFIKQFNKEYQKFLLLRDRFTLDLINGILLFARTGDLAKARALTLFLTLKFYVSAFHIFFPKFCLDNVWRTAASSLSPNHLFKKKESISNALIYLSNIIFDKYRSVLASSSIKDKDIVRFVYEIRMRIIQSMKSFSKKYYSIRASGGGTITVGSEEDIGGVSDETGKDKGFNELSLADEVSRSITYGSMQIDWNLFKEALRVSGLEERSAVSLLDTISDIDFKDSIYFILLLIYKVAASSGGLEKNMCVRLSRSRFFDRCYEAKVDKYVLKDLIWNLIESSGFSYLDKKSSVKFIISYFILYTTKFIC